MSHDEEFITRWAHFCVSFVEVFSDISHAALFMQDSVEDSLQALQTLQGEATLEALAAAMQGHLDRDMLRYFVNMSDGPSCGML